MRVIVLVLVVVVVVVLVPVAAMRALYHAFGPRHASLDRDAYEGDVSDWLLPDDPESSLLARDVHMNVSADDDGGALRVRVGDAHPFAALVLVPTRLQLAGRTSTAAPPEYARTHVDAARRDSLRACEFVRQIDRLPAAQANASRDCRALRAATFALGGDGGHTRFLVEYDTRLRLDASLPPARALVLALIDAADDSVPFAAFGHGVSSGARRNNATTTAASARALRALMFFDGNGSTCDTLETTGVDNCVAVQPVTSARADAALRVEHDPASGWTPWVTVRVAFLGDAASFYVSAVVLVATPDRASAYAIVDATPTPWLLVPNHKRVETNFFPYAPGLGAWMPGVGLALGHVSEALVRHFRVLEYDARAMTYTSGPLSALADADDAAAAATTTMTLPPATTRPPSVPLSRQPSLSETAYTAVRRAVLVVAACVAGIAALLACAGFTRYSVVHARTHAALLKSYEQRMTAVWVDERVVDERTVVAATAPPPTSTMRARRGGSAAASRRTGGSATLGSGSYTHASMSIDGSLSGGDTHAAITPVTSVAASAYGLTSLARVLEEADGDDDAQMQRHAAPPPPPEPLSPPPPYANIGDVLAATASRRQLLSSPDRLVTSTTTASAGSIALTNTDADTFASASPRSSSADGGTMLERRLAELRTPSPPAEPTRAARARVPDQYDNVVAQLAQRAARYDKASSPLLFTG
jgi:hypothetical protein